MITAGTTIALLSIVAATAIAAKCSLPEPGVCGVFPLETNKDIEDPIPWTAVLIVQPLRNGPIIPVCGGTLISDRFVLTPAHCFDILPESVTFKVRLGGWNITRERDCDDHICAGRITDVAIVAHIIHEGFDSSHIHHDIALVKLAGPVTFTKFVSPICLPRSNIDQNGPASGDQFYRVVGWNMVADNYVANVTDIAEDRHQSFMDVRVVGDTECNFHIQSISEICTTPADENNLQNVDFARSLISRESDGYWYQRGHGVWEFENPKQNESDVFTRIIHYSDWILRSINSSETC